MEGAVVVRNRITGGVVPVEAAPGSVVGPTVNAAGIATSTNPEANIVN